MERDADRIFIEGLEIEAVIGIYDWEREVRQCVAIDLELPVDARHAARSDTIESTFNYKSVAKRVIAFVSESRFQLVETLAERIAQLVIEEFDRDWIVLRVTKPGAIRGARDVGVRITRTRGDYAG